MTIQGTKATCKVIKIPIDIGSISSTAKNIIERISNASNRGGYVCVANVHMLTIARANSKFMDVLTNSDFTIADGVPLVWTQRLKGHKNAQRVCGPDLMLELCHQASNLNQPIFLLGGSEITLALLVQNLTNQFPNLTIAGAISPEALPEQPLLDVNLVDKINSSGAKILFVGLGCPKQEFWCAMHAPHLKPLSIGVGAAFDFHAGTKRRPSIWMQKCGLEWLYRLTSEPKRLWKRYLISNAIFLYLSLAEYLEK